MDNKPEVVIVKGSDIAFDTIEAEINNNKIENDSKVISLRVKVDSYKDLQNYLANELKLTKKDIEDMLEKLIKSVIDNKLDQPEFLRKCVERVITEKIANLLVTRKWNLHDDVNAAVTKVIGEKVIKEVKLQLTGINILNNN